MPFYKQSWGEKCIPNFQYPTKFNCGLLEQKNYRIDTGEQLAVSATDNLPKAADIRAGLKFHHMERHALLSEQ